MPICVYCSFALDSKWLKQWTWSHERKVTWHTATCENPVLCDYYLFFQSYFSFSYIDAPLSPLYVPSRFTGLRGLIWTSSGHCSDSINNLGKCNRKLATVLTDGPFLVQKSALLNAQQFNTSLQRIWSLRPNLSSQSMGLLMCAANGSEASKHVALGGEITCCRN